MNVMKFGIVNKNNRRYDLDSFKNDQVGETIPFYVDTPPIMEKDKEPDGRFVIEKIDNTGVYGSFTSATSEKLSGLVDFGTAKVVTAGTGSLEPLDDGVYKVIDYELTSVFLANDPA